MRGIVYLSALRVSIDCLLYLQRLGVTCGSIAVGFSDDFLVVVVVVVEAQGDARSISGPEADPTSQFASSPMAIMNSSRIEVLPCLLHMAGKSSSHGPKLRISTGPRYSVLYRYLVAMLLELSEAVDGKVVA